MHKSMIVLAAFSLLSFDRPQAGQVRPQELRPVDPLADTECASLPANFVVSVEGAGRYTMPPGLSGGPSAPGCSGAYVVDFVSERPMNSFKPDPDWVVGLSSTTECTGRCENDEGNEFTWDVYRGDIHVYRCTTPRDCANHNFSDYVGSMESLDYSDVGILSAPQRCILRPASGGGRRPIPTVRDAYGVRMVVKYRVDVRADGPLGPCGQGPSVLEPPLAFAASGSAGFITAGQVNPPKRPRAVLKPPR